MDRIRKFLRRSVRLFLSVSMINIIFGGVSSYGGTSCGGTLTHSDISLITQVTEAEAEGESEYGKRLVIDTILNRMDQNVFPKTAKGVIYQTGQFESVRNGRLKRAKLNKNTRKLVEQELKYRTNNQVVFFQANSYSKYGCPLLKEGNHYFSVYVEG